MPEYYAFERRPGIDLRGVDLVEATLQEAELPGANLDGVAAYDALANGIVLTGASLIGADVTDADFTHAKLGGATLSSAAPTDEMDCELFLEGDRAAHLERIRSTLGLTGDGKWLTGRGMMVVVDDNARRDGAGFLAYPVSVEWYFAADVGLPLRVALVGSIIRVAGGRAVAACDYEDAF